MKQTIYFLIEEDGRVRQIVNKNVVSLNVKKPLPNNPIGSADITIFWERNLTYWGVNRNFGLPDGYVTDGATILKNDYYKGNIDRKLFLLIKRLVCEVDAVNYKIYYRQLYKGELDFSTFEDDKSESKVTITIMEGGISKLLKANENTKFAIPFDDDAVNIIDDGMFLLKKANYIVTPGFEIDNSNYAQFWFAPFTLLNTEGSAQGLAFFSQEIQNINALSWDDKLQSTNFFAQAANNNTSTIDLHVTGVIEFQCTEQDVHNNLKMRFIKSTQLIANQNDYQLFNDIDLVQGQVYTHPIDITVPLVPGERIYLEGFLGNTGVDTKIEFTENSKLSADYKYRAAATTIKAFKPYDLYKKLCLKLGLVESEIASTILQTCTFFITCGNGIRGLPGSAVITSMSDFFKAFHVYLAMALDNNAGKLSARSRVEIFDTSEPIELGKVKDLKPTPATNLQYSSIKIGHAEQNIDDVNGKFDFNGWHIYTTPIKRSTQQQDLQSPYSAGPYEIEIIRINLEGKTTTDNDNDNKVYVIDCKLSQQDVTATVDFTDDPDNIMYAPAGISFVAGQKIRITGSAFNDKEYTIVSVGSLLTAQIIVLDQLLVPEIGVSVLIEFLTGQVYELDRSVIPDSGVPDPDSIFNVRLRVSEIFKKHYSWTKSWLYNYDGQIIKVESANSNKDLIVNGKADYSDINIDDMGERIFIPDYLECTAISPIDLAEQDQNKAFAIDWEDRRYLGFNFKSGLAPVSRAVQVFKLLSSIENDRESLIL